MEKFNFLLEFNTNLIKEYEKYSLLNIENIKLFETKNDGLKDFIKKLSDVLDLISNIFNNPYIITKTNEIVIRNELVSNYSLDSFKKTMQDASLWKEKENKELSPELVYSFEYEDTFINYENIFIIYVFNQIIDLIANIKELNIANLNSLRSYYGTNEASLSKLSLYKDLTLSKDEISEYLYGNNIDNDVSLSILNKIHFKVKHLKLHKFYKVMKNYKFNLPIKLTNTILHDFRYNKVYRFFKDNLLINNKLANFDQLFFNYSLIRFISFLKENKDIKNLKIPPLVLTNEDVVSFKDSKELSFSFNNFKYSLKLDYFNYGFILNSTFNKNITSKTFIKTYYSYNLLNKNKELDLLNNYDNYLIITNSNLTKDYNNVSLLSYFDKDNKDISFVNILLSTQLLIKVDNISKLIKCPYCGELTLINENDEYHCSSCLNKFKLVEIANKHYIYLKSIYRS